MAQQRHIIGRTVLELNTSNLADVWSLQEEVSRLFQQQVVPEMEQLFDRLVGTNEVVRLDQIVVEVGLIDRHFLADDFLRNLLFAINQKVSDALQEASLPHHAVNPRSEVVVSATTRDRGGADWEVLLYFLQYGRLPWWAVDGNWQEWLSRWEMVMRENTNWQESTQTLLLDAMVRQRLVEQFPESFRHQLVVQLQPDWTNWSTLLQQAKQLLQTLELDTNTARQLEQQAWLLMLVEIAPQKSFPSEQWIHNWLVQLSQRTEQASTTRTQESDREGKASIAPSQRLRLAVETFPVSERSLWLRAIDQKVAPTSSEHPHSNTGEDSASVSGEQTTTPKDLEQRESLSQASGLSEATDSEPDVVNRADWMTLLNFLQQGRLPGSQSSADWQEWLSRWETVIQGNTNWQESMQTLLMTDATVRQRLVEQLPKSFRHQLVLQLQPTWTNWSALLEQAEQLMQAFGLDPSTAQQLEQQAWLLMLTEIAPDKPLPSEQWIHNWLLQLIERIELVDSVAATQESDGETERPITPRQQLRMVMAELPTPERSLWLTAIDQSMAPTSIESTRSEAEDQTNTSATLETGLEQVDRAGKAEQYESLRHSIDSSEATGSEPAITNWVSSDWALLLDFLQQGRLPGSQSSADWQEWLFRWEMVLQENTNWQESIRALLMTDVTVRQRLVEQFPESFRHQLVLQLQPTWTSWSTLLQQAKQLMQALRLDMNSTRLLERQAWRLMLAEIGTEQPFPIEQWIHNWLIQLVEGMEPADSTIQMQEQDRKREESIAAPHRLRTVMETFPAAERAFWLRAINQTVAPTSKQPTSSDASTTGDLAQRKSLSQSINSSEATDSEPNSMNRVGLDGVALIDFLRQGRLPASESSVGWQEWLSRWETVMQENPNWQESMRMLLRTDSAVRQRLVEHFPASFRHQLVLQLQPFWIGWYRLLEESRQISQMLNLGDDAVRFLEIQAWLLILAEIGTGSETLPTATWLGNWMAQLVQMPQAATEHVSLQRLQSILEAMPLDEPELWLSLLEQVRLSGSVPRGVDSREETADSLAIGDSEERRFLEDVDEGVVARTETRFNRPIEQPRTPSRSSHSSLSPQEEAAGIYVTQAGLVLLHPFLRFYLEAVGLVDGDTFRDELAQQTAIYLMHYLATRQTDAPEYELVLPKLLCGWQLDAPIVRGLELAEAALTEGETMLQTVINYWEVLKSTSPDGLREGFLQRSGKLTRANDGNWKLQVEQQAIDILLGRLPWGLSMVTLPWMESLLIVEWT